ncbi:MAG: hypothetical protein QNL87_06420 [Gammaproteobacteria bacterium]|nr:hypothetical protein [Gammaproteobacteria bacterium]
MNVRACLAVFLGAMLLAGPCICSGTPPRTLLISVFQTDDVELARELLANTSVVTDESGYHTTTRAYGTNSARPPGSVQQVRVVEGQTAHFSTGYRSPEVRLLWAKDTRRGPSPNVDLVTKEAISGFYVQAELHGKEVLLQLDRYNSQSQPENTGHELQQNIRTAVYGPLGGWLDAGGSLVLDKEPPVNRAYALRKHHVEETRLLVKVELAP